MRSLQENDVQELVELPAGRKVVGSKWGYKIKLMVLWSATKLEVLHRSLEETMMRPFALL